MKNIQMLIIDPQNDFADPKGSLFVTNGDTSMNNLSNLLNRISSKIDDIHVTMDQHHTIHIAHPIYWLDSAGQHPKPYTRIFASDVKNGTYRPTKPSLTKEALSYLEALENKGKYTHTIWAEHCKIGSWGASIYQNVFDALCDWEQKEFGIVDFVTKGSNYSVEHFSAMAAEVPDPRDNSTQLNTNLIKVLEEADDLLIAGLASSHCLRFTVEDIANNFSNTSYVNKIVLLEDCTAPVPGFEKEADQFINDMKNRGMRISNSIDYLK